MSAPSLPGPIAQEFIAQGRPNRPGTTINPTSITMHNTSNAGRGADAKAHSRFVRQTGYYEHNGRKNWVSWHFTVDDEIAIQHLPKTEMGWHAGRANASSLGIEVCMHQGIDQALANRRAAALVAGLLRELDLTRNDVKTHKEWTGKNCPTLLLPQWQAFLDLVDEALAALPAAEMAEAAPARQRMVRAKPARLARKDMVEIDHHLMAIPEDMLSSAAAAPPPEERLVKSSMASVFAELNALAAQPKADRVLFPNGIDYVELNVTLPNTFKLIVSGPKSRAQATESLVAEIDEELSEDLRGLPSGDTVPEDVLLGAEAAAAPRPVDQLLTLPDAGLYGTGRPARRFGIRQTIDALRAIGAEIATRHAGLRIGIGDISKQGGGQISGHASHRKGVDIDIRPLRNDRLEQPVTFQSAKYSRELTQELVQIIRANTIIPVKMIFFNDPQVQGVQPWPHHDNHLHVRFDIGAV